MGAGIAAVALWGIHSILFWRYCSCRSDYPYAGSAMRCSQTAVLVGGYYRLGVADYCGLFVEPPRADGKMLSAFSLKVIPCQ